MIGKRILVGILLISGLSLLFLGGFLAFKGNTAGATVTYGAAVLVLALAFIDQLKSFSGLGFKAEMVDRKLAEADTAIQRLRGLAASISTPLLTMAARLSVGIIGMTRRERYEFVISIEKELKLIGVPENVIAAGKAEMDRSIVSEMANLIMDEYNEILEKKRHSFIATVTMRARTATEATEEEVLKEIRALEHHSEQRPDPSKISPLENIPSALRDYINVPNILPPDDLSAFIAKNNDHLLDLDQYAKHRTFRRLQEWLSIE